MKLVQWSRLVPLLSRLSCNVSYPRVNKFKVLFFSTKTLNSHSFDSLYKRVSPIRDPKASIIPVLEKWVEDGNTVKRLDLRLLIRRMMYYRRFQHALEISHWMSDRRYIELSPSDVAIRLDLIFKVHGLENAEKYFHSIAKPLKAAQSYGALLYCYVKEKSVDKAHALVEEMKKLGFATTSFAYNMLVNLYSQTGQNEKIEILMQEMKSNGIPRDKFTLLNRLNAYAVKSDIGGMEKILNQMEEAPDISIDWNAYAIMANGYMKVGLTEKGLEMLKKVEEMTINRKTNMVLDFLLTLYARTGNKEELYRIWNLYKSAGRVQNTSYSSMITCLAKLDDIEGAEKIFQEFESSCTRFDFRVLNRLLVAYCKKCLFDKAESIVRKNVEESVKSGKAPYASTWNILAIGYLEDKQMPKAVEMAKNALLVGRRNWKMDPTTVDSCLQYLEAQRDVEGAEDFVKLLGASGLLTQEVYNRLLRTYIAAKKPVSNVLGRMKVDGFSVAEATNEIL
ncbi:Pentatricopeptide repeat [Macleaya cordata]|uniref:Pentatricopeptide repeat n=1 Tax=Macleaya cordata TaxID=56857 RepID=A0A200PQU9_MACCD|nr:Pentatricopeptide repeat [Macleaya cordata]